MARPSVPGVIAVAAIAIGASVIVYNMLYWQLNQATLVLLRNGSSLVGSFYEAEFLGILMLLLGSYLVYGRLRVAALRASQSSLASIIGAALAEKRLATVALVGAAVYGLVYAVASGILVVQPQVDFAKTYSVTTLTWNYFTCCGDFGTMPKFILFLSPSLHLAVELVPLSLLLLFVVPPLVGLNLATALFSVRRSSAVVTGRWMVASGAVIGLFTACPTCAGLFLAESVGGLAATTVAVALAPYQALFIGVSVPLLLTTPLAFAFRVRRARQAACALPVQAQAPTLRA